MVLTVPIALALAAGLGMVALALVVAAALSLKVAALMVPAAAAGGLIVLRPFWGLVLLVFLAQLDALSNIVSQVLPVSFYKLLTLATVGGLVLMGYDKPRAARLGPGTRELRYAVLFAIWMVLAFLLSRHWGPGFTHMVGFFSVMLLFWLIVAVADTPERVRVLVWALILSGLISAATVLLDTALGIRLLIIGLALAVAVLPFVPEVFWTRMATLFDFNLDRTLWRRLSYNRIGLRLASEHPVVGVGPGNFPFHYIEAEFRWFPGRAPIPRQLHNSYLETAVEYGLVGLACFLGVMLAAWRGAVAVARRAGAPVVHEARALAYAFGGWLIASAFMPNEDTKFMWILAGLCVASRLVAERSEVG